MMIDDYGDDDDDDDDNDGDDNGDDSISSSFNFFVYCFASESFRSSLSELINNVICWLR